MANEIPMYNPFNRYPGYNCFGCSPNNAAGLQMNFVLDGDKVVCYWEPQPQFQGWINILHGGIQATLMDEIASWYVFAFLKTSGFTSKMEVRHLVPIKIDGGTLKITATLKEMRRNVAVIQVYIYLTDGTLAAESLMHYFTYPENVAKEKLYYPGIEAFMPENEKNNLQETTKT